MCIQLDAAFSIWSQHHHHLADSDVNVSTMTANSCKIKNYLHRTYTTMASQRINSIYMTVEVLWCITYQILRQSRPSLRRWTASSSSWPSPRRRRLLPPAAAPLRTTVAPRDRGQHSAATSDSRACRQTFEIQRCYSSRRLLSISIPAYCAGNCVERRGESHHNWREVAIGWELSRSKL